MADVEVFPKTLNYGDMKRRSTSSRSYRAKYPSTNSTTFTQSQTINLNMPANMPATYYNIQQTYLKFTVTAGVESFLDRGGAFSFIKRLAMVTAGAQIADINNWNVLATALLDTDSSPAYCSSIGSTLCGLKGDALRGQTLNAGVARTFCIPFVINPLAMNSRMIPAFSMSDIKIELTLESDAVAVHSAGVPGLVYTDVELVCNMVQLSSAAQAQVDAATNGQYNILCNSYIHSGATRNANVTTLAAPLGLNCSSLESILCVHRSQATSTLQGAYSLGSRSTAGLSSYQYMMASEVYPQRPILVGSNGAESLAELLIAQHSLTDLKKSSILHNGFTVTATTGIGQSALSGADPNTAKSDPFMLVNAVGLTAGAAPATVGSVISPSNVGTFLCSIELESLSEGESSQIYSGISTLASTVQFKGEYAAVNQAFDVDFWGLHTMLLSLDMRGSAVFSAST